MFKNFYPTPPEVAAKIMLTLNLNECENVLDPSAGKGDLLTGIFCTHQHTDTHILNHHVNLYAVEIDPILRGCLQNIKMRRYGKDRQINVVGSNFLTFESHYVFDTIIMNPPFDAGDKHLHKAISMLEKTGGQIACILNSETLNNPHTANRKALLNKIQKYEHKFIPLGQAFKAADRKTSVSCTLTYIKIPKTENIFGFNLDSLKGVDVRGFVVDSSSETCVVVKDEIKKAVSLHKEEIKRFKDVLRSIFLFHQAGGQEFSDSYEDDLNAYIRKASVAAWKRLIDIPKFSRLMSSNVSKTLNVKLTESGCLEFTEANIYEFLDTLIYSYDKIMSQSIVEVFDHLTKYHKENRCVKESWWTNDAYKVNRKVILSYVFDSYSDHMNFKMEPILNDLDKVMMYLSGRRIEKDKFISGVYEESRNSKNLFGVKHNSEFFIFKVYKKATIHLEFKDIKLLELFNRRAAEAKAWLPSGYKERRQENIKSGNLLEYR